MSQDRSQGSPLWASLLAGEPRSIRERATVPLWYRRNAGAWLPVDWPELICEDRPSWESRSYLALDLETTGLRSQVDRIIELALVRFGFDAEGALIESERMVTLVNPGIPIPPQASAIHGIQDEDVAQAPSFASLAQDIASFVKGSILVAHNAMFDIGFLEMELAREGLLLPADEAADTLGLARAAFPDMLSYNLGKLAYLLHLPSDAGHRALGDALTCMRLFAASMRVLTTRCD